MIPISFSARALIAVLLVSCAAAATAGTITGTVRSSATAQPLGSIVVDAYDGTGILRGSATTDPGGTYILALPAGSYRVLAWDPLGVYATMFDPNAESFDTSRLTTLGANDTVRRDFSLVIGGTLAGSVVRGNGSAASAMNVEVYNLSGTRRASTTTNSQGAYAFVLPPGEYKVIAYDPTGEAAFSFYPGVRTFAEAGRVAVTASRLTGGVDFRLEVAARIGGTIFDAATRLPLGGMTVYAYTRSGSQVTATTTSANGMFLLSVPAGDYRIVAADPARRYATGFYGTGRTFETSAVITLRGGESQPGVEVGLQRGATIAGRVTDANGVPAAEVIAAAYGLDGTAQATARTDANGMYELLVAPGTYKLLVFDPQLTFATAFFEGARDFSSSSALGVAAGNALHGFDFSLIRAGRVVGVVREVAQPVPGVVVGAYDSAGFLAASTLSQNDGTYAFAVTPGAYRIVAFDAEGRYAAAYDGATAFDLTVARNVGAGAIVTVDLSLTRAVKVIGSVYDENGRPLSGVNVFALDGGGNRVAGATSADGSFIVPVSVGVYKFVAIDPARRYVTEYWENAPTLDAAISVTVTSAGPPLNLGFALEQLLRRRAVR